VVGLGLVGASESVAQTFYSRGAARPTGIFSFNLGVGVNPYRGGHWNWYSGRYYRHGNHFHWSPGRSAVEGQDHSCLPEEAECLSQFHQPIEVGGLHYFLNP